MTKRKSALKEERFRAPAPHAKERAYLAKLERLRKAVDEGVRSERAEDSSIKSIIAELDHERKMRHR